MANDESKIKGPVVITGVSGYVGQHLIRQMVRDGEKQIVGIDMSIPLYAPPAMTFYNLDIRLGYLRDILRREQAGAIVHLAFSLHNNPDTRLLYDINVNGTANVLAAAHDAGVEKVVLLSSTAVYGARPDNPASIKEDARLIGHPDLPFLKSQIAVEKLAEQFVKKAHKPEVIVLRPCIIPGRKTSSFMIDFLRTARFLPMAGGSDPELQFIHVNDLVRAIRKSIEHGRSSAFNIVSSDTISYSMTGKILKKMPINMPAFLAKTAFRMFSETGFLKNSPPCMLDFVRYRWVADGEKAKKELQFRPKYSSREALESMINL